MSVSVNVISIGILWICYFVIAVMVGLIARRLYAVDLIRHTVIPRVCAELSAVFFLAAIVRYLEASSLAFHWPRIGLSWVHGITAVLVLAITIDLWHVRVPVIKHIQLLVNIDFVRKWFLTGKRLQKADLDAVVTVTKTIVKELL